MDFVARLPALLGRFQNAELRYALIGGLAMAVHGIQRTTLDADFVLLLDDLPHADLILISEGYEKAFQSENVSHYFSPPPHSDRIGLLHAFRPATLDMLKRSKLHPLDATTQVPVVAHEDIIGLKIQALSNDPSRQVSDWSDIQAIVNHTRIHSLPLDWELISDYFQLFDLQDKLQALMNLHGPTL